MKSRVRQACRFLTGSPAEAARPGTGGRIGFPSAFPSASDRLSDRLLSRALNAFPEPHFSRPLRRAAREALALTEKTGYALLLLPELFAELAVAGMLRAEYLRLGRL